MLRLACIIVGAVATVAWHAAHAGPDGAGAMGYADARHLLVRTGFGPTDAEVREMASLSREQGIARLLDGVRATAVTAPPALALEARPLRAPRADTAAEAERRAFRRQQIDDGLALRAWWMQEMRATPSPLTERMTLFWHNHFVSSQQKVRYARLMYEQNRMLRTHALGRFDALLHAAAKDPAMLVYLDGAQNRRGQPNENFAREVMELFTLGEGHYTEQDIKEAARAFTGFSIDRDTGGYRYRPLLHDPGVKTVLGTTGRLGGDDVLDIILAQPRTAEFIVAKLWREFVAPDPAEVRRIAGILRGQDYDVAAALRALLASDAFWTQENRGSLVKSPVELVVGTLRQLDVTTGPAMPFAVVSAGMGQNLFSPPNVKGWPGGEAWINSSTLLARKQFLDRLARADAAPLPAVSAMRGMTTAPDAATPGDERAANAPASTLPSTADDDQARAARFARQVDRSLRSVQFNAVLWTARQPGATMAARMQSVQALLLPLAPVPIDEPSAAPDALAFMRATLLDPAYQLK
jgi:uncharacterized protein (DUF1800 family)